MAWAGPPGESRPAPLTRGLAPTGAGSNAGQFLWPRRTRSGTLGVGDTGGGGPTKPVPMGVRRSAPALRWKEACQEEAVRSASGNLLPIHVGGQDVGGTHAYSASLTAGLWEPAGGWRPRWRRELS